jgi:hypothetical protein
MGNVPVIESRHARAPGAGGWSAYCAAARTLREVSATINAARPAIEVKREGCDGSRSV